MRDETADAAEKDWLRLSLDEMIDQLCDEFERAWQQGQKPKLEIYLEKLPANLRPTAFPALAAVEVEQRQRAGEQVDLGSLEARFPQWAERVEDSGQDVTSGHGARMSSDTVTFAGGVQPAQDREAVSSDREVGREIGQSGRYKLLRELGSGAFGSVYLASDEELKRQVAIKVLRPRHTAAPFDSSAFQSEARHLATLDHPHIVPVYDVGIAGGGEPFIVSKYVDGGNLKSRMQKQSLSVEEVVGIVAAVAEGLQHAHQKGLVHRDVKPENILLDANGQPLLADFGLALHENEQRDRRNEVSGSPRYMAPEQTAGMSHYLDGRTDIWALGVILYELLTGRQPFAGSSFDELFEEIRERSPKPPRMIRPDVPPRLEEIALKCLRKSVTDRYPTAGDLLADLRAWQDSRTRATGGLRFKLAVGGVLLLAGGAALVAARNRWVSDDARPTLPLASPAEPEILPDSANQQALAGELKITVWDPHDPKRHRVELREALPLRAGDEVRIEGSADRPAYLYLIWIDSQGKILPLAPWHPGEWTISEETHPAKKVTSPAVPNHGWKVTSGSGMETVFLLGRDKPLTPHVERILKRTLSEFPTFSARTPYDFLWLANSKVMDSAGSQDAFRDLDLDNPTTIEDPLLQAQSLVQQYLKPHFALIHAFTFASGP